MLAERYHLVRRVEEDAFSVVPDSHINKIEGGAEADCTVKWGKACDRGEIVASGKTNCGNFSILPIAE